MKKYSLLFLFILIGIILFWGDTEDRISKANFLSSTIFYPFSVSLNEFHNITALKETNKTLREELANKELEKIQLQNKLSRLSSSKIQFPLPDSEFVMADIIGYSGNFQDRNIIIDKGSMHGIKVNYPVISNNGIVGKVVVVARNYSIILPLTHQEFKVAVLDQSKGIQGLLENDVYGNTYISMIKLDSEVGIGDTVVTSNISRIFPKGFPVGTVAKLLETQDNLYLKAIINTYTNIRNLDYVYVLFQPRKVNYDKGIPTNN